MTETPHPGSQMPGRPGAPQPDDRLGDRVPPRAPGATPTAGAAPDPDEVTQLRAEVSALRARLDTRRRRAVAVAALRRVTAAVLVAVTAFALVASVVGGWAATTALNTDRWVATVAPLPQNPQVAAAVADYATNQVFRVVDVEQRLRAVLPEQAAFVAGPITGQLREAVIRAVTKVLQSDRFQRVWIELNRRAHQRALAIINGTSDVVAARRNRIDIDLLPLINQTLRELSAQLPTLFGKQLSLPDLSSGAIPDDLRLRLQDALGVTLPADFARFTVYDSGQLWAAQQAVAAAKRDLFLLVIATIVLFIGALLVSPGRRRTLLQLGLWLVISAVTVTAVLRGVRAQVLREVPAGIYRDGVAATLTTVFSLLRTRGVQLICIGAVLALLMYLAGPGRVPRWLRHRIAAGARASNRAARAAATRCPKWTANHLDLIRVCGVVVSAVFALLLSSWTALLAIVLTLAAFEVLVTLVARSAGRRGTPSDAGSDQAAPGPVAAGT